MGLPAGKLTPTDSNARISSPPLLRTSSTVGKTAVQEALTSSRAAMLGAWRGSAIHMRSDATEAVDGVGVPADADVAAVMVEAEIEEAIPDVVVVELAVSELAAAAAAAAAAMAGTPRRRPSMEA